MLTQKPSLEGISPRAVFTGLMSVLATTFGSALAAQSEVGQADILTDVLKIGSIIAIGTAVMSFLFWTIMHGRARGAIQRPIRGAVAGFLTALCVIPLPVFAWQLKTEILIGFAASESLIGAFFGAFPSAVGTGLLTFAVMTKASLIALTLSTILGYFVSRWGYYQPA